MKAAFAHRCISVVRKADTIAFYEQALGLRVKREVGPEDGSWTKTFMGNEESPVELEITWANGRQQPYDNGSPDSHIAFTVDDFEQAHALHEQMGCIVDENPAVGIYFIADPEGQWIEVLPRR